MIPVLIPMQMRELDELACSQESATILMRRAGSALAAHITEMIPPDCVVAIAGPGNNGGDAFAAFSALDARYERIIYTLEHRDESDARRDARERAIASGVEIRALNDAPFQSTLSRSALILDGILGMGTNYPLRTPILHAIDAINSAHTRVLAVDIPSGLNAATGALEGHVVRATRTLALGALKPGLLLDPGRGYVGELYLHSLGISSDLIARTAHNFTTFDAATFLTALPSRDALADKRTSGALLVLAGSQQFPGAAVLCARAAMRAGAGYVTVVAPQTAASELRAHLIEAIVSDYTETASPDEIIADILDAARRHRAIAIGPGLGLDDRTGQIVRGVLERTTLPCVVDASALFHLSKHLGPLAGHPIVLTPHAGEFARLSGEGTVVAGTRVERLRHFVSKTGISTLLKGRDTLIDDGQSCAINPSGTSALATAGSGDVLTGIIGTLMARGSSTTQAAALGAYWHGLAGQVCEQQRTVGTIASDLPEALGAALALARTRAQTNELGTFIAP